MPASHTTAKTLFALRRLSRHAREWLRPKGNCVATLCNKHSAGSQVCSFDGEQTVVTTARGTRGQRKWQGGHDSAVAVAAAARGGLRRPHIPASTHTSKSTAMERTEGHTVPIGVNSSSYGTMA